jgi:hypothetical protein
MKDKDEKDKQDLEDTQEKNIRLPQSSRKERTFKKNTSAKIIETKSNLNPLKEKKKKLNLNHSQIRAPKCTTDRIHKENRVKNKVENQSLLKTLETITYINTVDLNTQHNESETTTTRIVENQEGNKMEKELLANKLCDGGKKSSQIKFESMLERMKNYEIVKEKKLELMKNEIKKEMDKSKTNVPKINENSKKITSESFFQRQEKYIKAKEEKLRNLKQHEEENKKQIVTTKKVNKSLIDNHINNQLKWENERKQKRLIRKEQELQEEAKYCTFKPQTNNTSKNFNRATTERTNEIMLTKCKDDLKIDLSKSTRGTDFTLPKPLKKHDSCKLYRSLLPRENENIIIENLFSEKFKELTNKFN